jgi:SanA protein
MSRARLVYHRLVHARLARWLACLAVAGALGLGLSAHVIEARAAAFVSDSMNALPHQQVGLVLGCSERLGDGRPNQFFRHRMAAAAELYRAGKVEYLLLSGDHSRQSYDEPSDMRRALLAAGVPDSRIVLDYAGFRTLDSVLRAQQVFGLQRFTVVSQRFHDVRAVYLAREHGIDAYGFAASDVGGVDGLRVRARELFSRAFALLDVLVLSRRARFSGPPESPPWALVDEAAPRP